MSDSHDRAPEPGVADYEPGDAQADAAQDPDQAVPPAAGTPSDPAAGRDDLAPGRGVVDPDAEPAEPNEPA